MSVLWGVAAVVVMMFAAEPFVGMFVDKAKSGSDEVIRLGGQYMRGYVWDCILAGIHFCFSGYFCARGLSGISFLHNSLSIICVRIPLSYFASKRFTDTLLPMGLASPAGSALSVLICVIAYILLRRRDKKKKAGEFMEKQELFRIGDVAKMFRISISSLRHYEKIGLLQPEYIDPSTGYRYYSTRQFECLNTICYLRALDMPLPCIADFLKNRDVDKMRDMLRRQKTRLSAEKKSCK